MFEKPLIETAAATAEDPGTAKLVGASTENIFNFASKLLEQKTFYNEMARSINPYGDGQASKRIVSVIFESFGLVYDF